MVKLVKESNNQYVIDMAHDDYESGHPVEDFKEFAKILRDDGIEATDSLWNIYLDNCCSEDEALDEGLTLKEAVGSDYKVFTLAMDVAFPEGKTPRDYGVNSSVPGAQLFKELSKALETLGLEMAGDYVSQEADITDVYKDNEYEFFNQE